MSAEQDTPVCAFCLPGQVLRPEQVLLRGAHFYLCAPRGQIVEGFLIIAPYRCRGLSQRFQCLADIQEHQLDELCWMCNVVAQFFRSEFGEENATYYEQGRAGGGAVTDAEGRFSHHAHLCCLPLSLDLHALISQHFESRPILDIGAIPGTIDREPYIYVNSRNGARGTSQSIYVGRDEEERTRLERMRLKREIAQAIGCPERADWRVHPGDDAVRSVIAKFHASSARSFRREESMA